MVIALRDLRRHGMVPEFNQRRCLRLLIETTDVADRTLSRNPPRAVADYSCGGSAGGCGDAGATAAAGLWREPDHLTNA